MTELPTKMASPAADVKSNGDALSPKRQPDPEDFTTFAEGDLLDNKLIDIIMFQDYGCIVFLDSERGVYWQTNSKYENFCPDFGAVMRRVDFLLSTPQGLLSPSQRDAFRRMIASAIVRLLDDCSSENANLNLAKAEEFLRTRATERARIWFLSSTGAVTLLSVAVAVLLNVFRGSVEGRIGVAAFAVVLATLMGSVGTFMSLAWRLTDLKVDPMAGPGVHYFEGVVRAIAGMTGALVIALGVKSNILLGLINSTQNSLTFLAVLGLVAGASERLVPNTIEKVENTLIVDGSGKE